MLTRLRPHQGEAGRARALAQMRAICLCEIFDTTPAEPLMTNIIISEINRQSVIHP